MITIRYAAQEWHFTYNRICVAGTTSGGSLNSDALGISDELRRDCVSAAPKARPDSFHSGAINQRCICGQPSAACSPAPFIRNSHRRGARTTPFHRHRSGSTEWKIIHNLLCLAGEKKVCAAALKLIYSSIFLDAKSATRAAKSLWWHVWCTFHTELQPRAAVYCASWRQRASAAVEKCALGCKHWG